MGVTKYVHPNTPGYVLFNGIGAPTTYLIDKCGRKINQWTSQYNIGLQAKLMPDGRLLRGGMIFNSNFGAGKSGVLEIYDWSGKLEWRYIISTATEMYHHDFTVLPNGNILLIVWEAKSIAQAVDAGKDPAKATTEMWTDKILEIKPIDSNDIDIVWEWHAWDHLVQDHSSSKPNFGVVSDHPELLNINYHKNANNGQDWLHLNAIDYNPALDQIVITCHSLHEIYIIDHSTNIFEAYGHSGGNSGKGGDILYRWGNPEAYGRGTSTDKVLFSPHNAHWIPPGYPKAGNLLIFNNGLNRPGGNYSSLDMIDLPESGYNYTLSGSNAYGPSGPFWSYKDATPVNFYTDFMGGVQELKNGNYIFTESSDGRAWEIDSSKNVVWRYTNPVNSGNPMYQGDNPQNNMVFRFNHYAPDFPGLSGKNLTPGAEIELNPLNPPLCNVASNEVIAHNAQKLYPNPSNGHFSVSGDRPGFKGLKVFDASGRLRMISDQKNNVDVTGLENGLYLIHSEYESGQGEVVRLIKCP